MSMDGLGIHWQIGDPHVARRLGFGSLALRLRGGGAEGGAGGPPGGGRQAPIEGCHFRARLFLEAPLLGCLKGNKENHHFAKADTPS